jgi:NADH-quinone oxidoreductase subunit L
VIIGMHHEQDMRKMGGLRKYMPITFITAWIGTLALMGFPFFSAASTPRTRSSIAVEHAADIRHGGFAYAGYLALLIGVGVTSLLLFPPAVPDLPRQGALPRWLMHTATMRITVTTTTATATATHKPHETPWVVTLPLVLLAIPSMLIGFFTVGPMLFGDFFGNAIVVAPKAHDRWPRWRTTSTVRSLRAARLHDAGLLVSRLLGFALATYIYLFEPGLADKAQGRWPGPIASSSASTASTSSIRRCSRAAACCSAACSGASATRP